MVEFGSSLIEIEKCIKGGKKYYQEQREESLKSVVK
tara:strand:+ start:94 stop:201 length:108 start_codon:yes stop_codon:yes gene_type:complete